MLTGGIDLSVGPLTGFLVVVASFFIVDKPDKIFGLTGTTGVVVGVLAITIAALAVGLFNGLMVRKARIPAVVVTLATFIGLQGLSQFFRVTTSGQIQRTRHGPAQGQDRVHARRADRRPSSSCCSWSTRCAGAAGASSSAPWGRASGPPQRLGIRVDRHRHRRLRPVLAHRHPRRASC